MTTKFLKSVNISDFNRQINNPKTNHEALSSYIIANYLFSDINERIKFFKDINNLFDTYLSMYSKQYSELIGKTLTEVASVLKDNIKLVYKGGNIINYYQNIFRTIWEKINVDIKADTLSDFDFSILINYDYILETLVLSKTDENYIKLSRLADLISYNLIKHFNNYMFCYDSEILKVSSNNSALKPSTKIYYKFGNINHTKIMENFTYANDYFLNIIKMPTTLNLDSFITTNIDKINNGELNHDLKLQFDIITKYTKSSINFIGFSLPTTFNKHKQIFNKLDLINENNSIKLSTLVRYLINTINITGPDILSTNNNLLTKIRINNKLVKLNERYDRIKTKFVEVYPTNDFGNYCTFLPTKIMELYEKNIKSTDNLLTKYYNRSSSLQFNTFYNINFDKLSLYDEILYAKFIKSSNLDLENYTKLYLSEYFNTHENMISISSNSSLLFGATNLEEDWEKITNFNLHRGKIPVRYFFKLDNFAFE
jgi:hypothetical protein